MQTAPGPEFRVWRGPVLDWLQHRWPSPSAPEWADAVIFHHGVRVARVSGYAASIVRWDLVRSLVGTLRVSRLDLAVDFEGPQGFAPIRASGGGCYVTDDGETFYRGAGASELQWKLYRYTDYPAKRDFAWLAEAEAARADLERTWRLELRARGRRARWLAQAETISEAWAWAQTLRPAELPDLAAAREGPRMEPARAADLSLEAFAAKCRRYIASQARRHGARVGLGADGMREFLGAVARRAIADLLVSPHEDPAENPGRPLPPQERGGGDDDDDDDDDGDPGA